MRCTPYKKYWLLIFFTTETNLDTNSTGKEIFKKKYWKTFLDLVWKQLSLK